MKQKNNDNIFNKKLPLTSPQLSCQTQAVGSNSVGLQIKGNKNIVNISIAGAEPLNLIPWFVRGVCQHITADVQLLQPYCRAIEMVGRDKDMSLLRSWLDSDPAISVRTLTGPGGSGKTRMAIELLRYLETVQPNKWLGGFLPRLELVRFLGHHPPASWQWRENSLIVVDYAATLAQELRELLRGLTSNRPADGRKLRILLIEREADPARGWLQFVQESGDSEPVRELFCPLEPQMLMPISSVADRRTILQKMLDALGAYGQKVGKPVRVPQLPQDNPSVNRQLADSKWNDPLYLMMAGLLAIDGDIVRILALPRRAIAEQTVHHEIKRIKEFGSGDPAMEEQLLHLASVSTLRGGLPANRIISTIEAECTALAMALPMGARPIMQTLRNALPAREDGIAPILPDLLGEVVLVRQLGSLTSEEQTALILRAVQEDPFDTAAVILRTCHDYAENDQSLPIGWLDAYMKFAREEKPELFLSLWMKMPDTTVVLRKHALGVVEQCLKLDITGKEEFRVIFLADKSVRLSALGRREEALSPAQEAVRIHRKLSEANPDAFLPNLAMSLNNLAAFLSALGRREEALSPAQEAADIYRKLSEANPDAFLPNLAGSLNNLANRLSELGRREEALSPAQEAVRIHRKLSEANPDAFLPDLAASLNNLATCLSALGRREEALSTAQEAVRIRRKLSKANPDAFLPNLAMSCGSLGAVLTASGEYMKAADTFAEGIQAITIPLRSIPQAFSRVAAALCRDYLEAIKKAGQEPNMELLKPVIEIFQLLQNNSDKTPDQTKE